MTWVLPRGSSLGRLTIEEVYDSYDGPRLFSAGATSGSVYLAFWVGETSQADEWLYVPISRTRLDEVVEGVVGLREAFTEPEDGFVFHVRTPFDESDGFAAPLPPARIPPDLLPDATDRLMGRHGQIQESKAPREVWQTQRHGRVLQKLKLAARRNLAVSLEAATACLARWSSIFTQAFEAAGGEGDILPLDASPGSFNINLTIPKGAAAARAISQIRTAVGTVAGTGEPDAVGAFDVGALEALVATLRAHRLMLTIDQEASSGSSPEPIVLDFRDSDGILPRLKEIAAAAPLDSADIPQADDLDRILLLADLVHRDAHVSTTSLQVVERQISYYKHAGRVLRILDQDNNITPVGAQLVALSSRDEKLAALAIQFETSRCGWRWIQWATKSSLVDLEPASAERFLTMIVPGLAPSTAKRRARTLESWCRTLQPYHLHAIFSRIGAKPKEE